MSLPELRARAAALQREIEMLNTRLLTVRSRRESSHAMSAQNNTISLRDPPTMPELPAGEAMHVQGI